MCTATVSGRGTFPVDGSARGEDFYVATREDILLAIRGDLEVATREDFLMAMDTGALRHPLVGATPVSAQPGPSQRRYTPAGEGAGGSVGAAAAQGAGP